MGIGVVYLECLMFLLRMGDVLYSEMTDVLVSEMSMPFGQIGGLYWMVREMGLMLMDVGYGCFGWF